VNKQEQATDSSSAMALTLGTVREFANGHGAGDQDVVDEGIQNSDKSVHQP